jgi:acyl-[acyl carrier protein]--UDP-N-acetylglucosamine O-acyltransferase
MHATDDVVISNDISFSALMCVQSFAGHVQLDDISTYNGVCLACLDHDGINLADPKA